MSRKIKNKTKKIIDIKWKFYKENNDIRNQFYQSRQLRQLDIPLSSLDIRASPTPSFLNGPFEQILFLTSLTGLSDVSVPCRRALQSYLKALHRRWFSHRLYLKKKCFLINTLESCKFNSSPFAVTVCIYARTIFLNCTWKDPCILYWKRLTPNRITLFIPKTELRGTRLGRYPRDPPRVKGAQMSSRFFKKKSYTVSLENY